MTVDIFDFAADVERKWGDGRGGIKAFYVEIDSVGWNAVTNGRLLVAQHATGRRLPVLPSAPNIGPLIKPRDGRPIDVASLREWAGEPLIKPREDCEMCGTAGSHTCDGCGDEHDCKSCDGAGSTIVSNATPQLGRIVTTPSIDPKLAGNLFVDRALLAYVLLSVPDGMARVNFTGGPLWLGTVDMVVLLAGMDIDGVSEKKLVAAPVFPWDEVAS